jgi:aspartate-semialdehyde dehydrogenase
MKSHVEEVEDDLAAEEENKLINEVRRILMFYSLSITAQRSVKLFQEYKTW